MDVVLISEVVNARRTCYYDMWHVIRTFHIPGELKLSCHACKKNHIIFNCVHVTLLNFCFG